MEYEFIVDRLISIGSCSLLSILFVCSLYVWGSHHDRCLCPKPCRIICNFISEIFIQTANIQLSSIVPWRTIYVLAKEYGNKLLPYSFVTNNTSPKYACTILLGNRHDIRTTMGSENLVSMLDQKPLHDEEVPEFVDYNNNEDINKKDHSTTIKRRFLSVFIVVLISPAFVYFAVNKATLEKRTLWELLGLRKEGLVQAFVMPLFLTMILFSGPIYMQSYNGLLKLYTEPMYWVNGAKNLIWLRNHVVAPLAEEFTYRSCMLPILGQCFEPLTAVFVCPLFFGAGHLHHMIERMRKGEDLKKAFIIVSFQFLYTTIFGTYSAYIFQRTGHFASTFIVHAFCNHMGFPDVQELVNYEKRQRTVTACVFVAGFVLWCCLLNPLTEPAWYYNDI